MVQISVVGCDGCVKSTLIEMLRLVIPSTGQGIPIVVKRPREVLPSYRGNTDTLYASYLTALKIANDNPQFHFLFDRFVVDQIVYSVLRGEDLMGTGEQLLQDRYWKLYKQLEHDPKFWTIFIDEKVETIFQRTKSRGEDYLKPEDVQRIIDRFKILSSSYLGNKIVLKPGENVSTRVQQVISQIFYGGPTSFGDLVGDIDG